MSACEHYQQQISQLLDGELYSDVRRNSLRNLN